MSRVGVHLEAGHWTSSLIACCDGRWFEAKAGLGYTILRSILKTSTSRTSRRQEKAEKNLFKNVGKMLETQKQFDADQGRPIQH